MSARSSVFSGWQSSILTAGWGLCLFGVLQIRNLPLDAGHSVCGPWGCGPPLPPLIAYHGFWLVLFSLPTALVCRNKAPVRLRRWGWCLVAAGLCGLLVVGLWEIIPPLPHWLPRMRDLAPQYYVQRYLLSLATLIDVPVVPIMLAGLACVLTARSRRRKGTIPVQPDLQPAGLSAAAVEDHPASHTERADHRRHAAR